MGDGGLMALLAGAPAGTGSLTPTKSGWHLVQFANGWAAVVRWAKGAWQWGSITPPSSAVSSITYLAPTIADIAGPKGQTQWGDAMRALAPKQSQALIGSLDIGTLQQGQPTLVNATGEFQGGGSQFGSSAVSSPVIPTPSIPNPLTGIDQLAQVFSDAWNWIKSGKSWLKVLEFVGGAVAIWLAIKSLTGIETPKISIDKAAAAAAL